MIRISLPAHLRTLAHVEEVEIKIDGAATMNSVLDALESRYPMLRGTIRDYGKRRRPFLRFFACGNDVSHDPLDALLPEEIAVGAEPLLIVGAIAGG